MQEINPVSTPVVTPPVVIEQPKKSNFLVILLSILLLLSVLIAGFFAYQTQKLVSELTVLKNEPTPTAIAKVEPTDDQGLEPEPIPLEILTKDWKTFSNNDYKFLFRYPKELTNLYDQLSGGNLLLQNFDGSNPLKELISDFQLTLSVSKYDGTALESYPKNWESDLGKLPWEIITVSNTKAVKGYSGQKYKAVPTVWVTDGKTLFTIQLSNPDSTNKKWFDQILSTFKFIQ